MVLKNSTEHAEPFFITLMDTLYFVVVAGLKIGMMSYSDNGCHVTNYFCRFEKFLANTLFLPNFIAVRSQIAEFDWGLPPPPPHQKRDMPNPNQNSVNNAIGTAYGNERKFWLIKLIAFIFSFIRWRSQIDLIIFWKLTHLVTLQMKSLIRYEENQE